MKVNFNQSLTAQISYESMKFFAGKKYSRVDAFVSLAALPVGLVESVARLAIGVLTALPLLAVNLVSKKDFSKKCNTAFVDNVTALASTMFYTIMAIPSVIWTSIFGIKKLGFEGAAEESTKKAAQFTADAKEYNKKAIEAEVNAESEIKTAQFAAAAAAAQRTQGRS